MLSKAIHDWISFTRSYPYPAFHERRELWSVLFPSFRNYFRAFRRTTIWHATNTRRSSDVTFLGTVWYVPRKYCQNYLMVYLIRQAKEPLSSLRNTMGIDFIDGRSTSMRPTVTSWSKDVSQCYGLIVGGQSAGTSHHSCLPRGGFCYCWERVYFIVRAVRNCLGRHPRIWGSCARAPIIGQ